MGPGNRKRENHATKTQGCATCAGVTAYARPDARRFFSLDH